MVVETVNAGAVKSVVVEDEDFYISKGDKEVFYHHDVIALCALRVVLVRSAARNKEGEAS